MPLCGTHYGEIWSKSVVWTSVRKIQLKSSLDKPQNTNKHFAYFESETKWDKVPSWIKVGSTGSQVKAKVNGWSLPGGGIERDKLGIVGPTEVVGKPPQSGGVGGWAAAQGSLLPCSSLLGNVGPT